MIINAYNDKYSFGNTEDMNTRIKIKESSELEMEAIKGVESEGMPSFFVNGYDMAITLTDQH